MRWLLVLLFACHTPSMASPDAGTRPDAMVDPDSGWDSGSDAGWEPPDASGAEALSLSIVTWNIEQFPRHDGTLEHVRALIEEHGLDLIGIQEITDPDAFEALAASLPDHAHFISFDRWAYTRVGFLYRTSLIEVGEVERLFSRDTQPFPRDPLMAEIRVKDEEGNLRFDFTFVVVHLKAMIDDESRQRRTMANVMLDEWIRERMTIDPDVVVVGDFNDELTDEPTRNVFRPFLTQPDLYRFLTLENAFAGEHSYIPFRAMIDHVLVTSDALVEYGEGATEVLAIDESMPGYRDLVSDHRPVVSHFAIP